MFQNKKSYGPKADNAMRGWIELVRAFTKIRAKESVYIEQAGLTIHQFGVLEALYHLGGLSVGELTKVVLSTPGNMTVVIKNLKDKNMIETYSVPEDKRRIMVRITEKGAELIAEIFPGHAENMTGYFSGLDEDEIRTLTSLLRKLEKSNR